MYIVNKSNIYKFEKDICKGIFKSYYSQEYEISDNYEIAGTELFRAYDKKNNKNVLISLFDKPTTSDYKLIKNLDLSDYDIYVFYRKNNYSKFYVQEGIEIGFYAFTLNSAFLNTYRFIQFTFFTNRSELGEVLLNNINLFLEKYEYNEIDSKKILQNIGFTYDLCYKYYSQQTVDNGKPINVMGGEISFSNPKFFNDPFDCDFFANYSNHNISNVSDYFKVFCTTSSPKDILMWSYYGESHKGYCAEYKVKNILNSLYQNYSGICVIGKVTYRKERPLFNYTWLSNNNNYTILTYLMNCAFTKYEKWVHENEFRFIIFETSHNNFYTIQTNLTDIIAGCKSDNNQKVNQLSQDNKEFKLI